MSRTYKDRPSKVRFPEVYPYWVTVEKTKKRRKVDTEWHWMNTPSWWVNLFMNRPIRNRYQIWERNCEKSSIEMLDGMLEPEAGKAPHKYYW